MRLKHMLTFILAITFIVLLRPPVYAVESADPEEKRFVVTGVVTGITKDSITVLSKEKERVFSLKRADIKYNGKILTDDIVKIIYGSKDKKSAQEIHMVTPSKAHSVVYLTFDDGPDAVNTPSIIKTLVKYKAGGTFFFTGKNMLAYKPVVKSAHDNGFAIGLHGYDHTSFAKLSEAGLRDDVNKTNGVLYSITKRYSVLTRPPYGSMNNSAKNTLSSMGMKNCLWTVDTRDWAKKDASEVLLSIKQHPLRSGDVILMHSGTGQSRSAQVLPQIIEYLRSQGFEPVNLPGYSEATIK